MILSIWVKTLIVTLFDLVKQTEFYPYEYMNDFGKFKEKVPSKEKF